LKEDIGIMYATFCEIADDISATIETIGHYLCPPPQRLKDRLAATSFISMLVLSVPFSFFQRKMQTQSTDVKVVCSTFQ
jgi:hypothetical protein